MLKKYIKFFIFACLCFIISDCFVNADTIKFNGTTMTSNNYVVMPSGNRTITFEGTAVYGDIVDFPQYYLLTICADNDKITTWHINNSTLSNVNIYDTSYSCTFPNSTYDGGHIVYIYGSYNSSTACNSSLMNCYHNGSFTLYNPSSSSWALLSYQNSKDNISIDYASNSIISQNKDIINQNNSIINQQQQIINQSQQTEQTIKDNLNTCRDSINLFNKNVLTGGWLSTQNVFYNEFTNIYAVSDFIPVEPNTTYTLNLYNSSGLGSAGINEYNSNQGFISSTAERNTIITFTTSQNTTYIRFTIRQDSKDKVQLEKGSSFTTYEEYGTQVCTNKLDDANNAINGMNDTLNNDDTSGATGEASDFFSSFSTETFGLTSIITAPLNLIQSLTSSTCTALHIPLPYLDNKYIDLPCMTSIYQSTFGSFFTMYQTITFGIIAYWVCVRVFNQVKDFKNPEHDEIEVLDL